MGYIIALSGKGGTGKTTIAALLVRILKERKSGSILAIDADPNSNLGQALGIEEGKTIGSLLEEISSHPEKIPAGTSKENFIEYQIHTAISEEEGFDLLTMGRPEGPGCYCYVNNLLRNMMGKLVAEYDYVIMDNEAGLEHFSRRTTRHADSLIILANPNAVSMKAAARVNELVKELKVKTKKILLLLNCADENIILKNTTGMQIAGYIPQDAELIKIGINASCVFSLENNSQALTALKQITDKII
ncbi:MAG: AAA family ATPase [Candidatus Omnitrophica bacterium]|jgi:CO dehydrogenase maturation factor|nr:AAA family ATPase [Candidatus Omnitrophota bacterium]